MDDDVSSEFDALNTTIEDLKTRIAALEDEARTTADGAKDAGDAIDAKISTAVEAVAERIDHIEQYLMGVLPAQVLQQAVNYTR